MKWCKTNLLTLFYVHINTVGIALWKEQNNSMLEQVVQYKRKSRKYNACEKVTSKKPKKTPTPTEFIQSTDFSKPIFATFLIKLHLSHSVWIYTSSFNIISQAWKSGHTPMQEEIILESSPVMLPPIPLICLLYPPALDFRLNTALMWHIIWHEGCAHANAFTQNRHLLYHESVLFMYLN